MNDRDEEDEGINRKNKQPATSKNPKGAGRPSREVDRERDFESFRENPAKWLGDRNPELFGLLGFGRDKGDGKGDTKGINERIPRGVVRRTLRFFKFTPKQIQKMNLDEIDEISADVWKQVMPHAIPKALTLPMKIAGFALWYLAEEKFTKTEKFTAEHWVAVPEILKKQYYYLTEPDDEGTIWATRKRLQPQIMHSAVMLLQWLVNIVNGWLSWLTGDFWDDALNKLQDAQLGQFEQKELYKAGIWRFADTQVLPSDIAADVDEDEQVDWGEERLDIHIEENEKNCVANWLKIIFAYKSLEQRKAMVDNATAEQYQVWLSRSGCALAEKESDTTIEEEDVIYVPPDDYVYDPATDPITGDEPKEDIPDETIPDEPIEEPIDEEDDIPERVI